MPNNNFAEKMSTVLSEIRVFKWPLFIVYRPRNFTLKGCHTRNVMAQIKPGDILVRFFKNNLSNPFIEGTFKQVGFYLGDVSESHLKQFAKIDEPSQFNPGKQRVIYAVGDKVFLEDVIDFCRCDGFAIMRFPRKLKCYPNRKIPDVLQAYFKNPVKPVETSSEDEEIIEETPPKSLKGSLKRIFNFRKKAKEEVEEEEEDEHNVEEPAKPDATFAALVKAEQNIAQYLAQGKVIEFDKIFKILYRVAIRELNTPYDYDFEIERFHATRSTELLYFITKSLCWNYGIEAEPSRIFLKQRMVITPDIFVDGQLEEIWKSEF
ncbi:MAG: hypothetical protein KAI83_15150 [Thiomargarita sp.]|nr:hypothetical protein [Thiomargarita sp.]